MSSTLELALRTIRFRAAAAAALIFGASACDSDRLGPPNLEPPAPPVGEEAPPVGQDTDVLPNAAFAGGIPIGHFSQPVSAFGSLYNGAALTMEFPSALRETLAAVKARGGKVTLSLVGNQRHYKDQNGHFDLAKWKARVDRYRSINFSSYIQDGTVIGHYLLDEPQDVSNWNGRRVSPATLEEMAKYSKQIWPGMATLVRTESSYLAGWSGTFRYLDAAWAQYVHRRGDVGAFLSRNVSDARRKGLALVVGLNTLQGGPNNSPMTAAQVRSWGSTLLGSSYPCAFVSWKYDARYLSSQSMRDAMATLRRQAQGRSSKTCRV